MTTTAPPPTDPARRRVDQLLDHYGESHRHPRNEAIHCVAVPLIMFSLCGLLWSVHPWAAGAFIGASLLYYARLSAVFLLSMALWSAAMLGLLNVLDARQVLPLSVGLFVGGWIAQFVGHRIEGKKPSFLEDIQYLWVGPLFVLSRLFLRLGLRW